MDTSTMLDPRCSIICSMLFAAVVAATAEEPASVPDVFRQFWVRYHLFREARKNRAAGRSRERFWEIDMTKFEP